MEHIRDNGECKCSKCIRQPDVIEIQECEMDMKWMGNGCEMDGKWT